MSQTKGKLLDGSEVAADGVCIWGLWEEVLPEELRVGTLDYNHSLCPQGSQGLKGLSSELLWRAQCVTSFYLLVFCPFFK